MSEPWEDFKSSGSGSGSVATSEGPWTEFKKSEGPWSDFPKRPIQSLNPTPEPSLMQQAVEGFRQGQRLTAPIAKIPGEIAEKAQRLAGDVVLGVRNIPHYLGLDPTLTTRENFLPAAGVQGVLQDINKLNLPSGPGDLEAKAIAPLLPANLRQILEQHMADRELSSTITHAIARGAQEDVTPENVGLAGVLGVADLPPVALRALGAGFGTQAAGSAIQQLQQEDKEGAAINATLAALMLGGALTPEKGPTPTGALPTEYTQGSPDLPFIAKNRPAIQLPDVQKFQETPPLIGSRPLTIEQRVLSPAEARMTSGTSEVTPTIPSAPKPEPLAGQVSFSGEGIPSAMQAKEMVPQPKITSREQLSGTKMFSGVPLPGDFERYQELTEDALRAIRGGTLPSRESLAEIEQIKNQYGGIPPKASAEGVQKLRPAVKIGDKVYIGEAGATHADILKANGFDPKVYTHFNEARGFVSVDKPGEFLNRQQAQQISGIPGTAKAGGLDSQDLPGATMKGVESSNALRELRTDSISQTQPSGNIPKVEEEVRGGAGAAREAQEKEIQERLKGSIVKEPQYHSTSSEFERSDPKRASILGMHFGSEEAASQRASEGRPGNTRTGKYWLDIKNPLRVSDEAAMSPAQLTREILSKDEFKNSEGLDSLRDGLKKLGSFKITRQDLSTTLTDFLKKNGYDGLVYVNEVEDRGSTSYVAFDKNQIINAISQKRADSGELYSGIPFRFSESKAEGGEKSPNIFWMQATGHLIPDSSYEVAKEITGEEGSTLERDMRQKGFAKVVKYGDSIFVDQNASSTQLAGLQNLAKAEGKKLYTNVNLYSGLPILDPQNWRRISDKFRFGTAPVHVGANEHVANRMIEYAASDITADVAGLGQSYKDNVRKAWIDAGVNAGLYVRAKQAPVINGQHYVRIPELGNVYVRPDLIHEVEQVVKRRGEVQQGIHQMFLDLATEAQLIGPTDFAFHTANMFSSVAKSPGKSGNYILDQVLRQQGVKHLDALARIGKNFFDVVYKDPSIQAELTKISALGALRPVESGRGVVAKLTGGVIDTGKWIGLIDRAGRLARNKMFDNLVEQGLVRDNPTDRREFINQMGQYNNKLMSKNQEWMKNHFSQFVVAGRTFNKNAIQSAALLNEVRAASPEAYAKMKLSNLIAATATWIAVPVVVNSIITGKPFGRSGTPIGKIDTGKDDPNGRHIVYDPAKMDLSRRGARILGIEATAEGIRQGDKPTDIGAKAIRDIINGQLHPWEGPPVRVAEAYKQEYAKSGQAGQSLVEALKAINPTLTAYFGKEQPSLFNRTETEQKGGFGAVGTQLSGAIGYGLGRRLRHIEVVEEAGKQPIEQMTLAERLSAEGEYKKRAEKLSPQQKAQGAGRAIQENTRRGQDLKKTLSKADVNWLDSREIPVQGFDNKLTIEGQKLYLTPKETDRLAEFMKEEYTKAISEARSTYDGLGEEERASYLKETFNFARDEARQRMVEELQKSNSTIESNRKRYKTPGLGQ